MKIKPTSTECRNPSEGREVFNYFNGALDEEQTIAFEDHLQVCEFCQEQVHGLDQISALVRKHEARFAVAERRFQMVVAQW